MKVGKASKLTALSRGRNLYGYAPIQMKLLTDFSKCCIIRFRCNAYFDALNDVDNIKSSVKSIKNTVEWQIALFATVDPKFEGELELM